MNVVTVILLLVMAVTTGTLGIAALFVGEYRVAWQLSTTGLIAAGFASVLMALEDRR